MADKINKNDLISEDALVAFNDLVALLDKAQKELSALIALGPKLDKNLKDTQQISKLTKNVASLQNSISTLTSAQAKLNAANLKLANSTGKVDNAQKKTKASGDALGKGTKKITTGISSVTRSLLRLAAVYMTVNGVMRIFKSIFEDTKALDSLNFSMKNIIKSEKEMIQTQVYLNRLMQNYGVNLFDTTRSYIKFRAAIGATNLSVQAGQKIFESFAKTSAVLGLSQDETNGVFLALEQMISKGKVTTEELRRQLGERIPGAFNIMANAIGVTVQQLDKMLRAGAVLSEDALPKLAAEMEKTFGIESVTMVDTLVAAQERLRTSWINFVKELNQSDKFRELLTAINMALVEFGQRFGFFVHDQKEGAATAAANISNIAVESKNAAEEMARLTANKKELDQALAGRTYDPKRAATMASFPGQFTNEAKLEYASYRELKAQQEAYIQAIADNWKRAYVEGLNLKEWELAKLEKISREQLDVDRTILTERAKLMLDAINEELKRRKQAADAIPAETTGAWNKRLTIFKAQQRATLMAYEDSQQSMKQAAYERVRDSGASELELDRVKAGLSMDLETNVFNFKKTQSDALLNYVKGHAKETESAEADLAKFKMDMAKKSTDFSISKGEREYNEYIKRLRDKKDADLAEIEGGINQGLFGLQQGLTTNTQAIKPGLLGSKYDTRSEDLNKQYAVDQLQVTKTGLEKMLEVENLTSNEIVSIKQNLFETEKALEEAKRAEYEKTAKDQIEFQKAAFELSVQAADETFNILKGFQDSRMQQLEYDHDREVNLAGDNTAKKLAADNKYDKEKRKLQRRQAILDKVQAGFNIIIATAKGVADAASKVVTIPLIPLIIGIGAASLAATLAQPIPAYELGGEHEGGIARYSEQGSELFIPDRGKPFLTPRKETVGVMPSGLFVPHAETQRILAEGAMNNFVNGVQDIDLGTTNSILSRIANKNEINIQKGFKMTNKSNIFGRYVTGN